MPQATLCLDCLHVRYEGDDRLLIMEPAKIARNYLRGWFVLDLVATFPFDLALPPDDGMHQSSFRFIRLAKLVRLTRLLRLLRMMKV